MHVWEQKNICSETKSEVLIEVQEVDAMTEANRQKIAGNLLQLQGNTNGLPKNLALIEKLRF